MSLIGLTQLNSLTIKFRTKLKVIMFMKKSALLIVFSFVVMGCGTTKVKLTECDHSSGWCYEIRDLASKSWKYAQLSKNVYNKPFKYDVSAYFTEIKSYENEDLDFYAVLFEDKSNNDLVLVFRGTDSGRDFITGNNPFKQDQNNHAFKVYDEIKQQYGARNYIVAGHSLGGGIAINISLNRENVTAFSFNGSPVFRNKNNYPNQRYSIVENGEILKIVRILAREANQLYTSIGCAKGGPVTQHDMRKLATCLTQIGGIEDAEARQSLKTNEIEFKYPSKED